jgi:NifU-like protein
VWDYSEKVKEHFFDPKNAGAVDNANATGEVGSISCGDALRLTLKVNPDNEVIVDAGFQTFGCGSAIASSSALTEIIKGKTLDEALLVSNQDIADFLDGLPPEKMHCSVMGREALQAAVADYRGEEWRDDHEEGALICKCFAIDEVMIEETILANNLRSVEEVTNYTKAGGGCSSCHEGIEAVLTKVLAEKGETFVPAGVGSAVAAKPKATTSAPSASSGIIKRIRTIEAVLEKVRPALQADNGDVELVEVDGKTVYVHLTGACSGCQMAAMTLGGIQQQLIEALGEFVKVLPDTEMPVAIAGA